MQLKKRIGNKNSKHTTVTAMTTIHVSITMEYMSCALPMGVLYEVCSRKQETDET